MTRKKMTSPLRSDPSGHTTADICKGFATFSFAIATENVRYQQTLYEMHVLLLGYRPALKKNLNFVFLFIRKGYKVFSSLRYENDLFIREKRIQYNYLT